MISIKRKGKNAEPKTKKGVILLKTVREGILTEKAIIKKGFYAKKVAPPIEYRKGCEIAVEIEYEKKDIIEKILNEYNIDFQGIVAL